MSHCVCNNRLTILNHTAHKVADNIIHCATDSTIDSRESDTMNCHNNLLSVSSSSDNRNNKFIVLQTLTSDQNLKETAAVGTHECLLARDRHRITKLERNKIKHKMIKSRRKN